MTIFGKLMSAFSLLAVIAALVGGVGWYGLHKTNEGVQEIAQVRLPAVSTVGNLAELQNAITTSERTLLIPSVSREDRLQELENLSRYWAQAEEEFSRFEALEKTAAEQALWQEFQQAWEAWKTANVTVTEMTVLVKDDDIERLETILVSRKLDHVTWVDDLDRAIDRRQVFAGQVDPARCEFGAWLKTFEAKNPDLVEVMEGFLEPHEQLHHGAAVINDHLGRGRYAQARQVFQQEVQPAFTELVDQFDMAQLIIGADIELLRSAAKVAFGDEMVAFERAKEKLQALVGLNQRLADQSRTQAATLETRSTLLMVGTVLVGVAAALGFGFVLARGLSIPIRKAAEMIDEIERGRYYHRLNLKGRKDEVGQMARSMDALAENFENVLLVTLNKLAEGDIRFKPKPRDDKDSTRMALKGVSEKLNLSLWKVRSAAERIASSSAQVSDSSQSLSQGATEQASSLEEISASMHELTSQTRLNAENANAASQLTEAARQAAGRGHEQMGAMVQAMDEITGASHDISKIIKVIDEIAFQTNLLALNAAVEAARAGQHGKGFAVVADEVRSLAARSAKAAQETAALIEGTVRKTENGSTIAGRTAEALQEILSDVTKSNELVAEIAAASTEQAQGIAQVNLGLDQIDKVTQQNTASAEQSAAAAQELSAQAAELNHMLERFMLRDDAQELAGEESSAPAAIAWEDLAGARREARQPALAATNHPTPQDFIALDDGEFGRY
ncbi:methyl-accepting chemotaxis protein [Desulfuromonas sp. AOP6]|uniref:methyl-accepting chemotaxis protein n=1 Tax=Desulfuromonas sp. AOP6 TaxID=1566351 RepID=UPI001280D2B0|nr:methyl-accepting chemotaxis protein [Desulfuromonas sp. AOP6]BCA80712.1 hypothetical protein AOP6_2499 [Desulfuromonas sp. AOP6]